jgi:hypothetical protein
MKEGEVALFSRSCGDRHGKMYKSGSTEGTDSLGPALKPAPGQST